MPTSDEVPRVDAMPLGGWPAQTGFRWPAEWEPHAATWVAWPHNGDTWPGRLAKAESEFAELVRVLARFEPVRLLLASDEVRDRALRMLRQRAANMAHVAPIVLATNDSWIRDYGATFLVHRASTQAGGLNWRYNAWGGKYPPWDDDNRAAEAMIGYCECLRFDVDFVLEGGAIDGNGAGSVLTTNSCVLHPNRNRAASRVQFERLLEDCLGARRVHWLSGQGVLGDDTDGHVDQLARFVGPSTVVAASTHDRSDPQYAPLSSNLDRLRRQCTADGAPLDVVALPMPSPLFCQGQRLPASYCNFYILNGAVVVPQFHDPADSLALGILTELFADSEVVSVSANVLVWGLGALHCLTQQQPRPTAVST